MKRVLSVLLICALLMAGLAVVASAAPVSITVDAQKTGDNVAAQVKLNDAAAVESWSLMTAVVTYNSDALTFVDAESAMEGMQEDSSVAGKLLLCWIADPMIVPADGVVAELTFTAKAVTEEQPIELQVGFYPEGMVLAGETTPMDNTDEANYSTAKAEPSDSIVIQPEGSEDPDQDPEEPTPTEATITTTKAPGNTASVKVKGEYIQGKKLDTYKIVISWDDMTYSYADGLEWDPGEHKWELAGTGEGWGTIEAKDITIANHSNKSVTATASYEAAVEGTNFTWSTESVTVVGAEGYTVEEPPTGTISATFVPGAAVITDLENPNPMGIIRITIE